MMNHKQLLIFDKSKATSSTNNKFVFKFERGIIIDRFRLKTFYIPELSQTNLINNLQTQVTSNDTDITSLQTQVTSNDTDITAIQNVMSTDTERATAVTALTTAYSAADTTLNNTLTTALTTKLDKSSLSTPTTLYIDSGRNDSYTEDGSIYHPFKTIASAMTAYVSNSLTDCIFRIKSGTYSESTIEFNNANGHIVFLGQGQNNTIIKHSSNNISNYMIKITNLKSFEMRNIQINNCKYGFRSYTLENCIIENCSFIKCGSNGTLTNHTTETQQNLATKYSTGTELSNGGALRCKATKYIKLSNNFLEWCLRAIRVESCGCGEVSNNVIKYGSDNGIYLRDAEKVLVNNNNLYNLGHNALLSIYCKDCEFYNNKCKDGWGAPICNYGSLNISYRNNDFHNCNIKSYTGYGSSPNDSYGQIVFRGLLSSSTFSGGDFISKIQNNSFTNTNTINSVIIYFDANIKQLYTNDGSSIFYFNNNYHPVNMTKTLETWTISDIDINSINIASNTTSISNNLTQISGKNPLIDANNRLDANLVGNGDVDNTELSYLNGVTSSIQTQFSNLGGAVADYQFVKGGDGNYAVLSKDIRHAVWSRNLGSSDGSSHSYTLPSSNDISSGHIIFFHSYNLHLSSSGNGGTIFLRLNSGQSWRTTSFHDEHITAINNDAYFSESDRNTYVAHYYIDGNSKYWLLRQIQHRLTDATIAQINKNKTYFKFFSNTEAGYKVDTTLYFQIPDGYSRYMLYYGDGTLTVDNDPGGVRCMLPLNPEDGTTVSLATLHSYTSSSAWDVIFVQWGTQNNCPGSRKMIEDSTVITATTGDNRLETISTGQKRMQKHFIYISNVDTWIMRNDSY